MSQVELLKPWEVALGPDEGLPVRRTLPTRRRSLIGGWCFIDHFGPQQVSLGKGMQVGPHPHTQLQTASWLFSGVIEHRDSAGNVAVVRPGELNLMTAGKGISHSERSLPESSELHGVQLWIALPNAARFTNPVFEHFIPNVTAFEGGTAQVFLGELLGSKSPVVTHSPLLGAELRIKAGTSIELAVNPTHEHGLLVDHGHVEMIGEVVPVHHLGYLAPGYSTVTITAESDVRLFLIGGEPLGEEIVMWWNFIGRSHEEIVEYHRLWQAENLNFTTQPADHPFFGWPKGEGQEPILAPDLPPVRLKTRS